MDRFGPIWTGPNRSGPGLDHFRNSLDWSRSRSMPKMVKRPDWTGPLNTNLDFLFWTEHTSIRIYAHVHQFQFTFKWLTTWHVITLGLSLSSWSFPSIHHQSRFGKRPLSSWYSFSYDSFVSFWLLLILGSHCSLSPLSTSLGDLYCLYFTIVLRCI